MIDVIFAAFPIGIVVGTLITVALKQCRALPNLTPEVVLVRAPYGFPKEKVNKEMTHSEKEHNFYQGPLHELKYPIVTQQQTERAMTEITNRLSYWKSFTQRPWFLLHAPKTDNVSLLETLLTTHGYNVCVMDYPVPTNNGFPTQEYYDWAEQCPFVKNNEDLIQSYYSSWQSWPNTGRYTSEPNSVVSINNEKDD